MKFRLNNKYVYIGIVALAVISGGIFLAYFLFHGSKLSDGLAVFSNAFRPVAIGLILAYVLTPITNYLENKIFFPILKKLKISQSDKVKGRIRVISILLTFILVGFIVYSLVAMLISQVIPSIESIVKNFDRYMNNLVLWIQRISEINPDISKFAIDTLNKYTIEFESILQEFVLPKTSNIIKSLSLGVIGAIKVLLNFIIGLMISIYLMASKEKFTAQSKKIVYAIFKTDFANNIISEIRNIHDTFIGFFSGKILDSLIIGLLCFIGTTLLGTPYAALVSVIIGVTNIIPYFGPWIGAIPTCLFVLIVDITNPINCLYFAIFILVLQQFDGNILGPKILGDSTGLSSFWVLFAITVFGGVMGVTGMVIGVPVLAIIYSAIRRWINSLLTKRGLPTKTEEYLKVGAINNNQFEEYVKTQKNSILNKNINLKSKKERKAVNKNVDEIVNDKDSIK